MSENKILVAGKIPLRQTFFAFWRQCLAIAARSKNVGILLWQRLSVL